MNERWQQVERIFHAARELQGNARVGFLAKTCAGDESLRREVESLLAQDEDVGSFLESPAIEMAAESLAKEKRLSDSIRPALEVGTMVAHYRLTGTLGAGGMGEVYRALDTKLQREVALKILPEAMAHDAERMDRFKREAHVLASLNHPNIAAIHGLEDSNGIRALVMELVEGETLGERVRRAQPTTPEPSPLGRGWPPGAGPGEGSRGSSALAIDDALPIARQMAEALEYAHERGVIHRDLKPANVKITPEGTVKVLDFGLAKVLNPQDSPTALDSANSPTLSTMATQPGMILGTAAYMSPEQAKGQRVDRRCDIWAFGCVHYEMLTGRKAFEGETISDVLAAVLTKEPDWNAIPDTTPPSIQKLIRRCLQKDVRRRLQAIGEARFTIEETLSGTGVPPVENHGQDAHATTGTPGSTVRRALPWALAALAIIAAVAAVLLRPSAARPPLRKFEIIAGKLAADYKESPEISPNGKTIAYVSGNDLLARDLDQLAPRKLYTLTGGTPVFWSPDSESIAFADQGDLWQIPAAGGAPREICTVPGPLLSGAWGADGTIFFSAWRGDMYKVSAQGGNASELGLHDPKTVMDFHSLSFLPGGHELLYVTHLVGAHARIEVLAGGKQRPLFSQNGWDTWSTAYSPTGDLLFMRAPGNSVASIWAVPFSLSELKVTGQPFLVAGSGEYPSVASDGTLLYVMAARPREGQLVWVDRSGKIEGTIGNPQDGLTNPALSPDGKRVAATAMDAAGVHNVFIYDVASGVRTPLLSPSVKDTQPLIGGPLWSPDGRNILFTSGPEFEKPTIVLEPSDGSGQPRELLPGILAQLTPQGTWLAYSLENEGGTSRACYAPFSDGKLQDPTSRPLCLPSTSVRDWNPRISPDGHYVAFVSQGAVQSNVYVTHFPDGNGRWQVSTNGGDFPVWNPRGDELFYLAGNELMSVRVSTQPSLSLRAPVRLFSLADQHLLGAASRQSFQWGYDVSASGRNFLMVKQVGQESQSGMVVDQNWFAEFASRKNN
jgi:serine/threonine protein kinase/Tol biopolymer transport system component